MYTSHGTQGLQRERQKCKQCMPRSILEQDPAHSRHSVNNCCKWRNGWINGCYSRYGIQNPVSHQQTVCFIVEREFGLNHGRQVGCTWWLIFGEFGGSSDYKCLIGKHFNITQSIKKKIKVTNNLGGYMKLSIWGRSGLAGIEIKPIRKLACWARLVDEEMAWWLFLERTGIAFHTMVPQVKEMSLRLEKYRRPHTGLSEGWSNRGISGWLVLPNCSPRRLESLWLG